MLCTLYTLTQKSWNVSLLLCCQRTVTSSTVNGMSKRPSSFFSHSSNSGSNKRRKTGMESNEESSQKQWHTHPSIIEEKNGDLFTCPKTHSLAHCISADVKMGKGIAVMFKNLFGGVEELKFQRQGPGGLAVLQDGERYIYYLVTKWNYWDKPTYETLEASLVKMRNHNLDNKVTNLCMPKIGCGLDRLKWYEVRKMIRQIYQDTNIKITIYHYEEDKKDKQAKPDTAQYDGERGRMHQNYPSIQNRRGYEKDNDHGRGQSRGSGGNSSSHYSRDGSYNEHGSRQSRGSGGRPPSQHNRGSYHDHRPRQSRDSNDPGSSSQSRHPNPNQRQAKLSEFPRSRPDSHEGVKTSEKDLPGLTKELHGSKDSGKKDDDAKQYRGEGTTGQTNQKKQASGNEGKRVKIDRKTYKSVAELHESRGGAEESGRNDEDRDKGRHSEREDRSENTLKDGEKKEMKKDDGDERTSDSQNERTKKNDGDKRSNQDGSGNNGKLERLDGKTYKATDESHESRGGAEDGGRNDEDRDKGRHSEGEDRSENTVKDGEKKKETKKDDGDERTSDSQNERTKKNDGDKRSNQDGSGNKKNAEKEWNNDDEHPVEKEERSQETNDHGNEKKKDDEKDDTFSRDQMKVKEEDLSQDEHKMSQVKDEENSQEFKEDSEARDIQSKTQRECSNKEDVNSDSDDENTSVETAQEPGGAAKDDKGEAMSSDSSHGSARRKRKNKKKNKKKKNR